MATWDKSSIVSLPDRNPIAVERALVAIFNRQTYSEQNCEETPEANGVGFSSFRFLLCLLGSVWQASGEGSQHRKKYHRQSLEIAAA